MLQQVESLQQASQTMVNMSYPTNLQGSHYRLINCSRHLNYFDINVEHGGRVVVCTVGLLHDDTAIVSASDHFWVAIANFGDLKSL